MSRFCPKIRGACVVAGLAGLVLVLGLVGCQSKSDPTTSRPAEKSSVEDPYGLRPDIAGPVPERTWAEPSIREVARLPGAGGPTLYNPTSARIKRDGRIYVRDAGDSAYLKAFTPEGEFVQGYGRGQGQGPGQVGALTDFEVRGDSIYVVDGRYRRIHVFGKDGSYGRTDVHGRDLHRVAYLQDATACIARLGPQSSIFLEIQAPAERPRTIPLPLDRDLPPMVISMTMDGYLLGHRTRCIYVPLNLPVLLTYSRADTAGRAYPLPGFDDAPVLEARVEENGMIRPPETRVLLYPTLDQGLLSVHRFRRTANADTTALGYDIFDVETMEYVRSVRLRIPQWRVGSDTYYAARRGLVTTVRDTTVYIYRVEDSGDGV